MELSDLFPSKFLNGTSLAADETRQYTIQSVAMEPIGENNEIKPVMHFNEVEQVMIVKPCMKGPLVQGLGNNVDNWAGKTIELYIDPYVQVGNDMKPGLRVRMPKVVNTTQPDKASEEAW